MLFSTIIAMKLLVGSIFLGTVVIAKPLENDDYRQYQNSGGNSYTPPVLSAAGSFGASQSGYSQLGNPGVYMHQSAIPPSSLNSFVSSGGSPFGAQSFGGSSYGAPGGYPIGLPNFFG